eukprot:gene16477-biopygen1216
MDRFGWAVENQAAKHLACMTGAKLSLPPEALAAQLSAKMTPAALRGGVAAWRHGGKAWRHGGKAWRHGGKTWRHGGKAWPAVSSRPIRHHSDGSDQPAPGRRIPSLFLWRFPLRTGSVFDSSRDGSHATVSYEARKRSHLNTDVLCKEDGLRFIPMCCEASGGSCGPAARKVWSGLANASAKLTGESPSRKLEDIPETLSIIILHQSNARAIVSRAHGLSPFDPCSSKARARGALELCWQNAAERRTQLNASRTAGAAHTGRG